MIPQGVPRRQIPDESHVLARIPKRLESGLQAKQKRIEEGHLQFKAMNEKWEHGKSGRVVESLKITIEELRDGEEEEIIIKCRGMTPELLRVVSQLKARDALLAYDGNEIHRVRPCDIFYIEAVDNKTFFYLKKNVFESKQKLYELEEILTGFDFLRISKSVIVNLSKVRSLSPALSGRFEATLENGEKVIISRQYVGDLKKRLGI